MQVIRYWSQLKDIVDPNYTYSCVGFTKGTHLFNFTHEHLYKYSVNKADKLFGIVWDNYHDTNAFMGKDATVATYDDKAVTEWFTNKGFDYLFIPDSSFIYELMDNPVFKIVRSIVDEIWDNEMYEPFLGNWNPSGNSSWIKLVFSRHYFLYTDITGSKFINRTFQAVAPDGTWGFLYKHFWEKYCGGTYEMVPILRNENGTPFDLLMKNYSEDSMDLFYLMNPCFKKFREDQNLKQLESSINKIVADSNKFNLESFLWKYEKLTLNKYIFLVIITDKIDSSLKFRLWEYDYGI
jgi:hypothetical protein